PEPQTRGDRGARRGFNVRETTGREESSCDGGSGKVPSDVRRQSEESKGHELRNRDERRKGNRLWRRQLHIGVQEAVGASVSHGGVLQALVKIDSKGSEQGQSPGGFNLLLDVVGSMLPAANKGRSDVIGGQHTEHHQSCSVGERSLQL